jgi:hypothetical protein
LESHSAALALQIFSQPDCDFLGLSRPKSTTFSSPQKSDYAAALASSSLPSPRNSASKNKLTMDDIKHFRRVFVELILATDLSRYAVVHD